ncbi:MAG: SpvB/TcaC N-terminal domain-containing protein [Bacteroidota bacterium]
MKFKISAYLLLALFFGFGLVKGQDIQMRTADEFNVNESGAATYKVPIRAIPGVNGMAPQIWLEYNSQSGNGILGQGWKIGGLSEISRVQPTYVQDGMNDAIEFDGQDRFALNGVRLMRVEGGTYGGNGTRYRPEIDDFTVVTSYGTAGSGPQKFNARDKQGLIYEYGYTADSRVEVTSGVDVARWRLNRVWDLHGNYMSFEYYEHNYAGQSLIKRIRYGGNLNTGQAHVLSMSFGYEGRSTIERIPMWSGGTRQVMNHRLKRIITYYGGTAVRTYTLSYSVTGVTQTSRLKDIQECGQNNECQPKIQFTWGTPVEDGKFNIKGKFPNSGYGVSANNYKLLKGDFNGNGRTDLIHSSSYKNQPIRSSKTNHSSE